MVLPIEPKSGSQTTIPPDNQTPQSVAEAVSHRALATSDESVVPDTSPASTGVEASGASDKSEVSSNADGRDQSDNTGQLSVYNSNLPTFILSELHVIRANNGNIYLATTGKKNVSLLRVGSKQADNFLRHLGHKAGIRLKTGDLKDINEDLMAHAELFGDVRDVWYRVALVKDGIELDAGDDDQTRFRVTCGKVEIVKEGSETPFYRMPGTQPFVMPADDGDLSLLDKYLNLHPVSIVLLKMWLSYTLAHPKVSTTSYVILVLQGDQGSGKSFLCRIIQALTDPCVVGVQTFPRNHKDLVIAAQHAHVLFYDNMREIKQLMADMLCIAATGGATTARRLYSDGEQHVHWLHVALVFNGIHDFINQPDLAQRSLALNLLSIDEKDRRSESTMIREFQADLPRIFRGLLDLIADVLKELPSAEPTNPERMYDFSHWLAAMEKVNCTPPEVYQMAYSEALNGAMLDSLMENPLAAAVLTFITGGKKDSWSGTPTELLQELSLLVGKRSQYSKDWPQTASAISKRLKSLQAGLRRQGIDVELSRGKERKITITNMEAF